MRDEDDISPYLKRPLRSLDEVLRQRQSRFAFPPPVAAVPSADNSNLPPPVIPPAKSA